MIQDKKTKWVTFEEAREFARSLNFKNRKEFDKYAQAGKLPYNMPRCPYAVYKNKGWTNWIDFLGTNNKSKRNAQWKSFEEAREFARKNKIKTQNEWKNFLKEHNKTNDYPLNPNKVYKDKGWTNWADFLGTYKRRNVNWMPFEEAREFARSLNLKSSIEWRKHCKSGNKPYNIPFSPRQIYKNEWTGWIDFLGKNKIEILFRGTISPEKELLLDKYTKNFGISMSTNIEIAKSFATKGLDDCYIKTSTLTVYKLNKEKAKVLQITNELYEKFEYTYLSLIKEQVKNNKPENEVPDPLITYARNKGYNVVDCRISRLKGEQEVKILDPVVVEKMLEFNLYDYDIQFLSKKKCLKLFIKNLSQK